MAFAMFWLFIGDLVILHQTRIFGHDFFGQHHQPFNKPGKSDESKTFQKYHKSVDKSDDGHAVAVLLFPFDIPTVPSFRLSILFSEVKSEKLNLLFLLGAGLRAPPAVC
jgi:hypothetical protein